MVLLRICGILLGLLGVAGFGLCGIFGVGMGLSVPSVGDFALLGVLGVVISLALAVLVWNQLAALVKRKPPSP